MRKKPDAVPRVTMSSRLPPGLLTRLAVYAKVTKTPVYIILEGALQEYLDDNNRRLLWATVEAAARVRDMPVADLMKELINQLTPRQF